MMDAHYIQKAERDGGQDPFVSQDARCDCNRMVPESTITICDDCGEAKICPSCRFFQEDGSKICPECQTEIHYKEAQERKSA